MTNSQKGVLKGMVVAVIITLVALLSPVYWPSFPTAPDNLPGLLELWLLLSLVVVFWLFVAIGRLAGRRFFHEEDINAAASSTGTDQARMLQSVLQNTLEQAVLAIVAYGAWLFLGPVGWKMLPVLFVVLFCLGRLLFYIGYSFGGPARAVGFALTFYPSCSLIIVLLAFQIAQLF